MNFRRVHLSCFNPYDISESSIIDLFSCTVDPFFNEECITVLKNNGFICSDGLFGIETTDLSTGEVVVQFARTLEAAVNGFMAYKSEFEDKFYTLEVELF